MQLSDLKQCNVFNHWNLFKNWSDGWQTYDEIDGSQNLLDYVKAFHMFEAINSQKPHLSLTSRERLEFHMTLLKKHPFVVLQKLW